MSALAKQLQNKCSCCGKPTTELVPDPRDYKQEFMVCVDCEYAITESYQDVWVDEPTDYRSVTSGY